MSAAGWLQLLVLVGDPVVTRVLGAYIAGVFGGGRGAGRPGLPPGRARHLPRLRRRPDARAAVDGLRALAARVQRSSRCSASTSCSALQGALSLNPTDAPGVPPALAFNTAASFVTNTNWQNYGGELDDEPPHPDGRARGAELRLRRRRARGRRRAHPRPRAPPLGDDRQLLGRPDARHDSASCSRSRSSSRSSSSSQGVVQNLHGFTTRHTLQGATQSIPGGPIASQEAIKELGENGGGTVQRELRAPVREPERVHEPLRDPRDPRDPVRAHLHVRPARRGPAPGLGRSSPSCSSIWIGAAGLAMHFEDGGQPEARGDRGDGRRQHGGQGDALRHRDLRALRRLDDRHVDRRGQLRRTTASRRSAAPSRSCT